MERGELESEWVTEEIKEYCALINSHGAALLIMDSTTSRALKQSR
ncbi:MAG: hypothetical protein U9N46_04570 [Euryarchaeota archaeon]|nr:hypothetical protein [Euryarchaeota archaeon]